MEQMRAKGNSLVRLLADEAGADVRRQMTSTEARWQSLISRQQKLHQQLNDAAKQQHHMHLVAIHTKLNKARELLNSDVECNPDAVHSHQTQLEVGCVNVCVYGTGMASCVVANHACIIDYFRVT